MEVGGEEDVKTVKTCASNDEAPGALFCLSTDGVSEPRPEIAGPIRKLDKNVLIVIASPGRSAPLPAAPVAGTAGVFAFRLHDESPISDGSVRSSTDLGPDRVILHVAFTGRSYGAMS